MHGMGTVQKDIGDAEADDLGDARAGVIQHGKQRGITLPTPGCSVGCIEQRLHLIARQKPQNGPIEAFARDGEHALCDRQRSRIAYRGVTHERADRGKTQITGARTATSLGLEMIQKRQDHGRIEILQGERGSCSPRVLLCVAQQQLEGVPVAGDRVRAHAALGNQAALEKLLQQRGKIDVGSAHGARSCDCSARRSKRCEAIARSSGTPVRYQ
jgi:hypothetical protein